MRCDRYVQVVRVNKKIDLRWRSFISQNIFLTGLTEKNLDCL